MMLVAASETNTALPPSASKVFCTTQTPLATDRSQEDTFAADGAEEVVIFNNA